MATSLTSLKPLNLSITDSYTFGNANVTANVVAGNVKTDNLLHANGTAWQFGGVPGGSNTYIQFNNSSNFGGSSNLTFDSSTNLLNLTGNLTVSGKTNLGAVGNITITGGNSGQVLQTDGAGNLSWATSTSGGGTAITVDNFTGDGTTTNFTLSTTPSSVNNVIVNYNGIIVSRLSYSLANAVLTFGSAPANNSTLEVTTLSGLSAGTAAFNTRTFTGDGANTEFTISSGLSVSTVLATIDGIVQTPTTDYTISGTTLTFTTAPYNGGAIQIRELGVAIASGGAGASRAQAMVMGILFGG